MMHSTPIRQCRAVQGRTAGWGKAREGIGVQRVVFMLRVWCLPALLPVHGASRWAGRGAGQAHRRCRAEGKREEARTSHATAFLIWPLCASCCAPAASRFRRLAPGALAAPARADMPRAAEPVQPVGQSRRDPGHQFTPTPTNRPRLSRPDKYPRVYSSRLQSRSVAGGWWQHRCGNEPNSWATRCRAGRVLLLV